MLQRFPWALAVVFSAASLTGCGLFSDDPDDDPFDVVYEESVPVEFTISDEQLCPPTEDCSVDAEPSPGEVPLPEVEFAVPIDIVEITGNEELREVSSRFKSVEIVSIDYEIAPNTLNIPSPELDIHMGPETAMRRDAQSVFFLANLPSAQPMTEDSGTVEVEQDARDQSSELFKDLKFTVIPYGQKTIQEGELFPPQGETDYTVTFNLKFTVNPTELE